MALSAALWVTPASAQPLDIARLYAGDLGLAPHIDAGLNAPADDADAPALRGSLTGDTAIAAVTDGDLAAMRGGFDAGGGVVVRFAFDVTTTVNGAPVQRLRMTDGRTVTMEGASGNGDASVPVAGARLPATTTAVLNGGATRLMTALDAGSMAQLVTNTADGQAVVRHAVFDITVSGLNADLARKAQHQVLMNALSTRAIIGR